MNQDNGLSMLRITPRLNRTIDFTKPVAIYRNLNQRGKVFSVKQGALVVGYATELVLKDCTFHINRAGQQRVREQKRKNVHAFIKGFLCTDGVMGTDSKTLPARVSYNPYQDDGFMVNNLTETPFQIHQADAVIINSEGVSAAYTS